MTLTEIRELVKKSGLGTRSDWKKSPESLKIAMCYETIILHLMAEIDRLEQEVEEWKELWGKTSS